MREMVVVITGASSGIGRATAHAFARQGARLVLAARREDKMHDAGRECLEQGALDALVVPTDVTREAEVEHLAQAAIDRFGHIDVWFNNAGVGLFGRFEDLPSDAWNRVIETNLLGYVYGARAAMRHFHQRGRGWLINNASIAGQVGQPDSSAYVASKFAVRGFAEALRQELLDAPDIHVCSILPSVIDTPFFQHAGNHSGHRVRAAPPVYTPEEVAQTVVDVVERPRAEVVVGGMGRATTALKRLAPGPMTRLNGRMLHAGFFAPDPAPPTNGTLFAPMHDSYAVRGGWRRGWNNGGVPSLVALGLLAAPLGLWAWRRLEGRQQARPRPSPLVAVGNVTQGKGRVRPAAHGDASSLRRHGILA